MSEDPISLISSVLAITKEARELSKDLLKDFHKYVENKEKKKIKKSLEEYRDFVGKIDDAYHELSFRLETIENSKNKEKTYQEFKDDFKNIIIELQILQEDVMIPMENNSSYFYKYPDLKDTLKMKRFAETWTVKQMEEYFEQSVMSFEEFYKTAQYGVSATRNALNALNQHIENKI